MKKLAFILGFAFIASQVYSQSKSYFSSGGEIIFSFATIDHKGESTGNVMRFSPVFNIQGMFNYDMTKHFGGFVGLTVRNVGYIYDNYEVSTNNASNPEETKMVKKKFRTYNLGIPVGLKLGVMNKTFVYGGYEIEFPFAYKEKTFDGDHKDDKFVVWFSDRVEQFQHGFFAGVQMPWGTNLKFKYYLSNFHNMDYVDNDGKMPYEDLNANIWYFSLSYNLLRNDKLNMPGDKDKEIY
jgi:hypothetical protein